MHRTLARSQSVVIACWPLYLQYKTCSSVDLTCAASSLLNVRVARFGMAAACSRAAAAAAEAYSGALPQSPRGCRQPASTFLLKMHSQRSRALLSD